MKVVRVTNIEAFQNPHAVEAKKIYDRDNTEVIHMTLKPGQSLKKHVTPVDVFFYILEGKGIVEIGNEKQEVEKDTLVESPKNIPHLLSNTGEGIFRFLVVKVSIQK
jgi:mannose-6-phosphate isomerase-like protein (cupin superfamily)